MVTKFQLAAISTWCCKGISNTKDDQLIVSSPILASPFLFQILVSQFSASPSQTPGIQFLLYFTLPLTYHKKLILLLHTQDIYPTFSYFPILFQSQSRLCCSVGLPLCFLCHFISVTFLKCKYIHMFSTFWKNKGRNKMVQE